MPASNHRRKRQTRREAGTQSQRPRAVRGGSAAGATNDWRSNLVNLRTITAGGATLLALTLAPSAHATVQVLPDGSAVCNTASQNWQGGSLSISSADPQGALHFDSQLRAMKDQGAGLYNAALQSRA